MTPTNYDSCHSFLIPSPPRNPQTPYAPKIMVCYNDTYVMPTTTEVYYFIQRTAVRNSDYQSLTERQVLLVSQEIPMERSVLFLNPECVSSNSVRVIFRNQHFGNFSLFSLLPREDTQSMTEALPPVSNDGTHASASADAVASTSASTSVQEQQADPSKALKREGNKAVHFCRSCNRAFATSRAHRDHMAAKHGGEKPYPCPHSDCDKKFSYESTRSNHIMKVHTDEKPYPCTKCDEAFNDLHELKVHKDTHSPEKRHKCTLCDKAYSHRSTLHKHKRNVHSNQK